MRRKITIASHQRMKKGGNYYAPELWVEERKGNLYLRYCHGRYGYWEYCFRYQGSDFMLIGYEATYNHGPLVLGKQVSIFLQGLNMMMRISMLTSLMQILMMIQWLMKYSRGPSLN